MSSTRIAAKPGEPWKKGDGPESKAKPGNARSLLDHWDTITKMIGTEPQLNADGKKSGKPISLPK